MSSEFSKSAACRDEVRRDAKRIIACCLGRDDEETQKEALELAMDIAQEKARRAFKKYDQDGKNGIDRKEFKQICIDLGIAASRKERKEAIKLLDTDGSGTIGEKEFVAWYGKLAEAEANAEANGGSSTDETDSGDFVPSALKDDKNEESMDISKVAMKYILKT